MGNPDKGFTPLSALVGLGNDGGFTLPPIDLNDYILSSEDNSSSRPPNLSPDGAGRSGAFRAAKRHAGILVSQQPVAVIENKGNNGRVKAGENYIYTVGKNLNDKGATRVIIRNDAAGHEYIDDPTQNRGPHFNTLDGAHFDYRK